jgi:hemerythrin
MKNEEFDRRMEFFLDQQARFAADLEKQKEQHDKIMAEYEEMRARQQETTQQIRELVGFTGTLRDAVLGLTYHVERHDQQIAANERAIAELAELGKKTDARLNALILTVERHISGHQH